ncbi:MAG: fatty acid desaturase, partial [Gammaproteobacteria bacterium]|nr:fatty acid desaturase [Gammaproteobacteria bacterium]
MINGILDLPWWGVVAFALALTHLTIVSVTIYLHRCMAHRAIELHPALAHFFRFWIWLTTGMRTHQWMAVHRKHHAKVDSDNDPHSPVRFGLRKVLLQGAELYAAEASNAQTVAQYGAGRPDDWIERHLYTPHGWWGPGLMLIIDVLFFGPIGLTVWAVQMLWIPVLAAGVVNGLGHHSGYRRFETPDTSTNLVPWGILIGGE